VLFELFDIILEHLYNFVVRAGESLLKLVADLKEQIILNDFGEIEEAIATKNETNLTTAESYDKQLVNLRDEMVKSLYEAEEELFNNYKVHPVRKVDE